MGRWEGLDRRKFPRVSYPCLVTIRDENDKQNTLLTHTDNIGIGGVCVIVKQNIKIFTPVDIELDLMDMGNHIKCKGKVVWNVRRKADDSQKPLFYDLGIEFNQLTDEQLKQVEDVLKKLALKPLGETRRNN